MPVRFENRRGKRHLVIDIPYRKPDGTWTRYRRDSIAATLTGARDEERRIQDRIARTGTPFESPSDDVTAPDCPAVTYAQVVDEYRGSVLQTDLKATTRRGYESILDVHLLPRFGSWPVTRVSGHAADELDLELGRPRGRKSGGRARGTRNNIQAVLRATLRFAQRRGHLKGLPAGLPRLKPNGERLLDIPTDHQVGRILSMSNPAQRRAFMLMAYAGLRPNEVRALFWRDVRIPERGAGFLLIRAGKSYGELHTPKTGQREVPLFRPLAGELRVAHRGAENRPVATTSRGSGWGQSGLHQAFSRTAARAGVEGCTVYCLRHYAITLWLRAGVPAHVVQKMAGHKHLSTTQRYVHYLKGDLHDAALLVGNILETLSGAPDGGNDNAS